MNYEQYYRETKDFNTLKKLEILERESPYAFRRILTDIEVISGFPPLDLHQYWDDVHYLLNGNHWRMRENYLVERGDTTGMTVRVNAIFGGRNFEDKSICDSAYYLLPDEVRQISQGLSRISETEFWTRFERAIAHPESNFQAHEDEPELGNWLLSYFRDLLEYYAEASKRRHAMLIYLS